ncbi:MAG TPA: ABC transporter ATP-binding protein [Candidatus Sumerlaeota bacterium]|nr:ABC transporter ATP-binding protein [Candidatus Sumerlaeota bacterium]
MLKFQNANKSFGRIEAVRDLCLEVNPGEVFGLLGPNGAGKSTTINMATGLFPPDSGFVTIEGESPSNPGVRQRLGIATQALSIYEDLSARENLMFFGALYNLSRERLKDRVETVLEFAGLTDRARDRVSHYSGGMKRRLNLAAALVHDPRLLLLDEPTVGVDPQSRNAIFESIHALSREGHTIIYTTHYIEEAARLCNRVAIMDHGRLLALDSVPGLIAAHGGKSKIRVVYKDGREECILTANPAGDLAEIQNSGEVLKFSVDGPDLEQVFLNLTGRELRD